MRFVRGLEKAGRFDGLGVGLLVAAGEMNGAGLHVNNLTGSLVLSFGAIPPGRWKGTALALA